MGYPMTWQRVVGRNRLNEDAAWHAYAGADVDESGHERLHLAYEHWRRAADAFNRRVASLRSDIARLESDTRDEGSICQRIAERTHIEADVVAAVLKEFLSW